MTLGGLFSNTGTNQGRAFKRFRDNKARRTLTDFADMLAEGVKPELASQRLGYSATYGRVLLQKLRAGLGWQAR